MTTQEQRITNVEEAVVRLAQNQLTISDILAGQEGRLRRLEELMEETRRDVRQNRRLWTHLAQRYGWLDEDGLFDERE